METKQQQQARPSKIDELKTAAAIAKAAPFYEKAERIGQAVDILIECLIDMQSDIATMKGAANHAPTR